MEKSFAKFISFVFHPLLIPTVGTIIILNLPIYYSYTLSKELKNVIYIWMFFSTFLLPVSLILILWKKNIISSIYLNERNERLVPTVLTLICYIITLVLLHQLRLPLPINSFILGGIILVILALIINRFHSKVSIHAIAIAGLFGAIYGLSILYEINTWMILSSIAIGAGLTMYARLKLNAHNLFEVTLGAGVGFITQLAIMQSEFVF